MRLQITPQLRLIQALECTVCKQLYNGGRKEATKMEVALFGAAMYEVCPCCSQHVAKPWAHGYKVRYTRWIKRKCNHPRVQYSGEIPCTGPVVCLTCGKKWGTMEEARESISQNQGE